MNSNHWLRNLGVLMLPLTLGACVASAPASEFSGGIDTVSDVTTELERTPITPRETSPFDEFRNILWGLGLDEESQRRQFDADRVVEENLIAQCMNELGFEYIPFIDNITLSFGNSENWSPDDPEWVATYGYGWVVTPPAGRAGASISMMVDNPESPNAPMLAELSETERIAWRDAFSNMGAGFEREVEGVTFRDCNNWARAVVSAERRAFSNLDEFAPLMEAIEQMHLSLRWEISDADRAWSTCMFDAGFQGFDRQWEASETILHEWLDSMSKLSSDPEWILEEPTPENSEVIAALHQREVAVATADLNCRISTDFLVGHEAHIHTVEDQFITDHLSTLQALRAAAEQRG